MLIKAEQKYVRQSPTKLRFVADSIRKVSSPARAIAYLEHTRSSARVPLIKTIKQAVANAKTNFGVLPDALIIKELMVNEGPRIKRGQPVSRGMFHPILHKTAHIRVVLETIAPKKEVAEAKDKTEEKGGRVKNQKAKVKSTSQKSKA